MIKKENNNGNGINKKIAVGMAGAVAAGAAAVVLSKPKNRKKAGIVLNKIKVKGNKLKESAVKNLNIAVKKEEKFHSTVQKLKKKAVQAKKDAKKVSKGLNSKSTHASSQKPISPRA
jgi:hypothetical protein